MPLLDLFFTMLLIALFFLWIWLVISIFFDIFRSDDLTGWAKALWTIFIIFLPLLGVLVYLIARGDKMTARRMQDAVDQKNASDAYIRSVAGGGVSTADELTKLAALREAGTLTDAEYEQQKAKLLA